jgi:cyclopropane-fatty-acyl-phospholipid synthase
MEALRASRQITEVLAAAASDPPPRVRAWDGSEWGPESSPATLVLRHSGALRSMLLPPNDLSAGEAYVFDDIDIEGDIFSVLEFAAGLQDLGFGITPLRILRLARRLPDTPANADERPTRRPRLRGRLHSVARDRAAVSYHYDTSNEFFRLILDPAMVYSCAYFLSPDEPLETAQRRKLDLICRKLDLKPGDRFLDVGCGWGALIAHAALEYGVDATGVTVSGEQAQAARRMAEEAGVSDRVRILQRDYREIDGEFDAIASIGMFEHVGRNRLPDYFEGLRAMLAPGGQLLNHGIVSRDRGRISRRPSFVRTYVFPDGELRPIDEIIGVAEDAGFELRDVEALRMHYARTLRHWVSNLEQNQAAATGAVGDRVYRIWRSYMAGSAVAFEREAIGVYQLLLSDPRRPWTYGRSGLLATDDS